MKKFLRFVLILFFTSNLYSQKDIKYAIEICTALSNFESLEEANQTIEAILGSVGITQNFALYPCDNIPNAAAFTFNGDRYIFYNPDYMKKLGSKTKNISDVFILAHEIAHHVAYHTKDLLLISPDKIQLPKLEEKRKQELEADGLAAFIMARMGYSLDDTKEALKNIRSDWRTQKSDDDKYSTHPTIAKRLMAVNSGYFELKNGRPATYLTGIEYFSRGKQKVRDKDYYGARRDYLASIEILDFFAPRFALAELEYGLKDYKNALKNINIAIEFSSSTEIESPEDISMSYSFRGNINWRLNEKVGACADWEMAAEMGNTFAQDNLKLCN